MTTRHYRGPRKPATNNMAPLMLWILTASLFASNRRLCSMRICGRDWTITDHDETHAARQGGEQIVGKLSYELRLRAQNRVTK
jgi:hypothetical protein